MQQPRHRIQKKDENRIPRRFRQGSMETAINLDLFLECGRFPEFDNGFLQFGDVRRLNSLSRQSHHFTFQRTANFEQMQERATASLQERRETADDRLRIDRFNPRRAALRNFH